MDGSPQEAKEIVWIDNPDNFGKYRRAINKPETHFYQ